MNASFSASEPGTSVRLTHWGVIAARGADAVSFLQGQLTNDLTRMTPEETRLAGFCSAKGRLQASFLVWHGAPDEVFLACAADLLPATLKRLSMFVMRAKCRLTDATHEVPLWGCTRSTEGLDVWRKAGDGLLTRLRLPDAAGLSRSVTRQAPEGAATDLPLPMWRWLEVESGVPTIEAATIDRFVPQMLNFELLGGVDFQKGCYPGQEVVARSQYRGTVKRRMFLFDVVAAASPGTELYHSADPEQPAGMVVNAALLPGSDRTSVLAEVKLAALETGTLHLGGPTGPELQRRALPYAVPFGHSDSA